MRVLVVEDNPEYTKAAKEFFGTLDGAEVTYADNFEGAMAIISGGGFDGALLDIFMPVGETEQEKLARRLQGHVPNYDFRRAYEISRDAILAEIVREAPVVLLMGEACTQKGIPFVVVTDMNHHGVKVEAATALLCAERSPFCRDLQEGWRGGHVLRGEEDDTLSYLSTWDGWCKENATFWKEAFEKLRLG